MRRVTYDLHITVPVTAFVEDAADVFQDLKTNRKNLRVSIHGAATFRSVEREIIRVIAEKVSDVEVKDDGS